MSQPVIGKDTILMGLDRFELRVEPSYFDGSHLRLRVDVFANGEHFAHQNYLSVECFESLLDCVMDVAKNQIRDAMRKHREEREHAAEEPTARQLEARRLGAPADLANLPPAVLLPPKDTAEDLGGGLYRTAYSAEEMEAAEEAHYVYRAPPQKPRESIEGHQ